MGKHSRKSNRKKESTEKGIKEKATYYTTKIVWSLPWLLDQLFSYILWLQLHLYRSVAGRSPIFIKGEVDSLKKTVAELTATKDRQSEKIRRLEKDLETKKQDIRQLKNDIEKLQKLKPKKCETEQLQDKLKTLTKEKYALEADKQETLRRLSEVVSVKLRDNNPNIVDLNDQCPPTKLAEMFSELYDNEWTTAYAAISVVFTEEQTISILLNMVMDAYEFCQGKVEEIWCILTEWFLDENCPGSKETMKRLRVDRKANICRQFSKLGKDFHQKMTKMCDDDKLKELLLDVSINAYVMKCIELCLLMVATDPPVVLVCPGWKATCILQFDDSVINRRDSHNERETGPRPTQQSRVKEQVDGTGAYKQSGNVERPPFDKELFKEYTCRGKYLDYIVWPSMFLHKDGPLLSKGIAQGTKIQYMRS